MSGARVGAQDDRSPEAIAVIEHAAIERAIGRGRLTLGTDNGSAFTPRAFRTRLGELGIVHRRGRYRDPEKQAFVESWFSRLKQRWSGAKSSRPSTRHGTRSAPTSTVPPPTPSRLAYRSPREVAATWKNHDDQLTPAA